MFSRRTAWSRVPPRLLGLLAERRRDGRPVLDLTSGNPTDVGLAWAPGDLAAALAAPGLERYRPDPRGLPEAREAVASWWRSRGVAADAARLVLTASTSEAYSLLFRVLADQGESVLVPQPSYPLFEQLTTLDAVRAVPYRLRLGPERWELPVDDLAARLPSDARAVLVVHPNNPTGSRLDRDEARALARLCRERSLALVSDEVFAELAWPGAPERPHTLLDAAGEEGCLGFALSGLSKACGLPQVKLAWIAVDGPAALVGEALARLELASDAYLSASTPAQLAAGRLLELGGPWRQRLAARVAACRALVAEAAARSGLRVLPADAGWYSLLALPDGVGEDALLEALLVEDGVFLQPGWLFDVPGHHAVVSLITPPDALREGLARLAARLEKGSEPFSGRKGV